MKFSDVTMVRIYLTETEKLLKKLLAKLHDEEKVRGCEFAMKAGANFVKTSTGFGPGGATAADIALMRRVVGPDMGVKASGGIRSYITSRMRRWRNE